MQCRREGLHRSSPRPWARRPRLLVVLAAAALGLTSQLHRSALGFSAAFRCVHAGAISAREGSNSRFRVQARASGFKYNKKKGGGGVGFGGDVSEPKGKSKSDNKPSEKSDEEESEPSTQLAKNRRSGKTKALATSKLQDLREKTLAKRQRREAELDEYEEGRALIAKYGQSVGVMPPKVAKRSAKRGMVIGGSFYGAMIAVFLVAIFIYKTQELIIPPTLMAFITLSLLALAIVGGSYGLMSASWDEDREGSVLGTEEFSKNMGIIGEGFRKATMQNEYEKAIEQRRERKKLLAAKEDKKRELLNK